MSRWTPKELNNVRKLGRANPQRPEQVAEIWIPPGFAHGFLTLSNTAEFIYKTTHYYSPEYERCLLWNDPSLAIDWPIDGEPVLAAKDAAALSLASVELFA